MKLSVGKIIWMIFSKILSIAFLIFTILAFLIFFSIVKQANLNFGESCYFLMFLCAIYSVLTILIYIFPFLPGLGLVLYSFFGYKILSFLQNGAVDNNFSWSLFNSIQGKVIDFSFWSGFIFLVLLTVSQFKYKIFLFLVKRKVEFALEIFEKEQLKWMKQKSAAMAIQAKTKIYSKKQAIMMILISIILMAGLVVFLMTLSDKIENKKHPILWEKSFPGTAIWLDECAKCGKKGSILANNIEPGEPRIANLSLQEVNKEMILDVKLAAQVRILPKFSLEVELKDPDQKTIFYHSKDELFEGSLENPRIPFQKRFYFTPDKVGEYTLKITPHSYGIFSLKVLVRDIIQK